MRMIKYFQQSRKRKSNRLLTSTVVGFVILLFILPVTSAGDGSVESRKAAKGTAQTTGETYGNVLHFTDIHFNPFYINYKGLKKLKETCAKGWENIFELYKKDEFVTMDPSKPPFYANETTYKLLVSSLEKMKEVSMKQTPDFIIFTGDFLVHSFDKKYEEIFGSEVGLCGFIKKTVMFVVIMLDEYFPNVPIYVSLGNNDSCEGNYKIKPWGDFLEGTMGIISEKWLEDKTNSISFARTYLHGGYFSVVPKKLPNTLIISLNSNFFHEEHKKKYKERALTQLNWLEKELEGAEEDEKSVWLLMHSPPGADYFETLKGKFKAYWDREDTDKFHKLITKYNTILKASFAGHTHMDEFKLVFDPNGSNDPAIAFVKICPSASNVRNTNNPAFIIYRYDKTDFSLSDYDVYYLDLCPKIPDKAWKLEYTFRETYECDKIDARTLTSIYHAIEYLKENRDWIDKCIDYMKYFDVNLWKTFIPIKQLGLGDSIHWRAYWCGICNYSEKDYKDCLIKYCLIK